MTHVAVQTVLWMDSGLPEDYATNTWHIDTVDSNPLEGTVEFFSDVTAFFLAVDTYLSSELEGTMAYRAYDMSDPEPRVPFYINGSALTPGTGKLPSEVALCSSFQGTPASGLVQARRRGRVYIGPLATAAVDAATGRPAAAFLSALSVATDTLAESAAASTEYSWVVFSPTGGLLTTITNGWVDNAFDTQRRRGLAATARTTWST